MTRGTALLAFALTMAFAITAKAMIVTTLGDFSCRSFLLDLSKKNDGEISVFDDMRWMDGYLSALNINLPTKRDVLKNMDVQTIRDWTSDYCKKNPTKGGSDSANALFNKINE